MSETQELARISTITTAGKRMPSLANFLAYETGIDAEMANAVFAVAAADLDAALAQRTDPAVPGTTDAAAGWAKVVAHANRGLNSDPDAIRSGEATKSGWAGAVENANRGAA